LFHISFDLIFKIQNLRLPLAAGYWLLAAFTKNKTLHLLMGLPIAKGQKPMAIKPLQR
jgi:hypothetical protein